MKKILPTITTYSVGHFYTDFICAFVLSLIVFQNPTDITFISSLVILYNVLAFGLQPFFGFIIDKNKKIKLFAIIGLILPLTGLFVNSNPIIASILLGIGNAIYHVSGGIVALNLEPTKAKYPGIYVAPGALGLFLGGILGYLQIKNITFILVAILSTLTLTILIKKVSIPKIQLFKERKPNIIPIVLLLLLISVCMRALIGFSLNLTWKSQFPLGITLILSIVLGKALGGILADKFGFMKIGITGLLIAAPLLVFFQQFPLLVFIGAFCFNLVMPITLTALAEAIPNYKGVAFGLTTLSLVIGFLLFMVFKNSFTLGATFTAIVILINIITLFFGLKKYKEMIV